MGFHSAIGVFLITSLSGFTSALGASSYYCEEPLLASLPSASFQSSSRSSDSHLPQFTKLHTRDGSGGWSPDSEDRRPWLQLDLRDRLEVTAVATQGRWGSADWVSSYQLQYSDSGRTWRSYRQENMPWTFSGNTDTDSVVQHKLLHSIRTRFLRLLPLEGNPKGGIGLRLEIYGCSYKSDVAEFDGHSALLYRFNQKSTSTVKNVISVRFRSRQANGVLLHGEGQRGDYITLELQRGRLTLRLNLDDAKPQSSGRHTSVMLGSLLDDHLWHSVLIERFNKQVNFTVDKDTQQFRTQGQEDSLEVDYELSFGGIPLPGKPGTFLRENFHGCLENLYYNGVNIIDMAKRRKPQIYTVGNVTFSCSESQPVAVTFLSAINSFLVLPTDWAAEGLSIRLQFRTWNQDGRLLTVPLSQGPKSSSLILQLSGGLFLLTLRGIPQGTAQISTGPSLCDGQWHSVAVEVKGQQVYLTVNNQKPVVMEITPLTNSLQRTTVIFGGCPVSQYELGCEKPHTGYQGCLRLIFINNQPINLSRIPQEKQANFSELSFDICSIRDRCVPNFCEHGGVCYQSWDQFYCNCSGTGYTGTTCHNSIYERSCEAYRNTASPSGVFTIDPDGSGPLEYTPVNCTIAEDKMWTVVGHDHLQPVSVRGSTPRSPYVLIFNYSISPYHIRSLVASSEHCQQEVTYRCRKSRLFDTWDGTPLSWWLDRDGVKRTYWGGSLPGVQQCSCSLEGNCRDMNYFCNCDADQETWVNDTGLLSYKDHLPLSEIAIGDTNRTGSQAFFQIGPLRCSGNRFLWNSASFFLESSYLHFPTLQAELSIDISFYFKTGAPSGLFLENVGVQDFIRLELSSPSAVTFTFDLGDGPVVLTVRSPVRLNDRQWHYIRAERNVKEASLQVDLLPLQLIEAAAEGQHRLQLNSQLFVGGAPTTQRGFLGCLRALSINGMTFDLNERAKMTPGMNSGCPGHCSSESLCHNGGRCLENRNSYICDCTHTAFTGANCKTAISASFERGTSVTYALQEPFSVMRNQDPKQLQSNKHSDTVRSQENVAFGFLTKHVPALLLSAQSYDQRYMAITLTQNGSLQIWYRLNQETVPDTFSLKSANLADGQFHWVRINHDGNQLHVQIDNTVMQQYSLSHGSVLAPVRILTLGRIRGSDITDEEVVRAGSRGFVGCLSSVQFNQAAPLKAALQNRGSSAVSVHGRLEESDCGAKSSTNIHITTHTGSVDESSKSDRGKAPLTNVAQSDSALIGGVVAAIVFTTLCVLAVLIRFLYQHREPQPPPAIAVKSKRPSLDVEPCKPSHVGKEYFI